MFKHLALALVVSGSVGSTIAVYAAEPERAPVKGTLFMSGKNFELTHGVAYETKFDDQRMITVLASDRALPLDTIRAVLRVGNQSDAKLTLSQTYVKLQFNGAGAIQDCQADCDGGMFTASRGLVGELVLKDGRVEGHVDLEPTGEKRLRHAFSVQFQLTLGLETAATKAKSTPLVQPFVSGKFIGNGKAAQLTFISAQRREALTDKPAYVLVLTEKDHSKAAQPQIRAVFGDFGSALLISFDEDGKIFGCEVAHANHSKKPFSSIGKIHLSEFDLGERQVRGQITTGGEEKAFDQTWDVDLKFAALLPAATGVASKPKPAANGAVVAATPGPATANPQVATSQPATPQPATPQPAVAMLNVHDLPLPKDATATKYNRIVEQLAFQSAASVDGFATAFDKDLALQGWTKDGIDLITSQSAILKRARGGATLIIIVKPEKTGSQTMIFTHGLEWVEK